MIPTKRKTLHFTFAILWGFRKFFQSRHVGQRFNLATFSILLLQGVVLNISV